MSSPSGDRSGVRSLGESGGLRGPIRGARSANSGEFAVRGVVRSGDDAQGPRHRLQTANRVARYVKGRRRCSRVPGARLRVEYLAGSGTQD
eukprot:494587-Prorocentrum_minimum.AAC.4